MTVFGEAQARDPRMVEAMRLHVLGKVEEAAHRYEALLRENPNDADILHALGAIAWQNGKAQHALTFFRRAAEVAPGNTRYAMPLANAQKECGDVDGAVATLDAVLAAEPGNQNALTMFFNLCADHARFAPASARLKAILETDPYNMMLHMLMVFLYERQGMHAEKLPHMALLLKADDTREEQFYVNYARALMDNGQAEEAKRVARLGLERYPGSEGLKLLSC